MENNVELYKIKNFVDIPPNITVVPATHDGRGGQHYHDFIEMVYVSNGFTLHSSEGKITMLITGDWFFVKPGEAHSYINAYRAKIYNLLFDPAELGSMLGELSVLPGLNSLLKGEEYSEPSLRIIHVPMSERQNVESAHEKIMWERAERKSGWEVSMKARLCSLLIRYSRMCMDQSKYERSVRGDDYYGYIYKALRYIDEHYAEDIDTKVLADISGLSLDYMARRFKAILNMTPAEYLRRYRIAKAMELLCTTDKSISEIGAATGFSDLTIFSRVFKANVGCPPAAFRKTMVSRE